MHPWARELETRLRRTLYQWRHMPGDMVVSDFIECPLAIHSTDFGILEEVDVARTDAANDIVSRHFHIQIREPKDIEKIRMPVVTHDEETTAVVFDAMQELFRGHHAGAQGRARRTSGSPPGTTSSAGGAWRRRCWTSSSGPRW